MACENHGNHRFQFSWWFGEVYNLFTVFFTVFESCPELLIATKQLEYELCAVLARVRSTSVRLCNGIYGEKIVVLPYVGVCARIVLAVRSYG
jgi:hypothetical protein